METDKVELPSIAINIKLQVTTVLDSNKVLSIPDYDRRIANYCMVSMGGSIEQFEAKIDKDGTVNVKHTFKPITIKDTYSNQNEFEAQDITNDMREAGLSYCSENDKKLKSHVIVWFYRRHLEEQSNPSQPENETDLDTPYSICDDCVRRTYLIGSLAVSLEELLVEDEINSSRQFVCKHNFREEEKTGVYFKVLETRDEINKNALKQLREGLREYEDEEKKPAKNGSPDHSKHNFMPSPLRFIEETAKIVQVQQGLVKGLCAMANNQEKLGFCDPMGPNFVSNATYTQLYNSSVCFTDMTHVVTDRVAEAPFWFLGMLTFTALRISQLDAREVARIPSTGQTRILSDLYNKILTIMLMDSKQAEYYSDYRIKGVEDAKEFEWKTNRQPIAGIDPKEVCSEKWFYVRETDAENKFRFIRYRLAPTEDQRQICTGKGFVNRIIADDCETAESAIKMVEKTAHAVDAAMQKAKVYDKARCNDRAWLQVDSNANTNFSDLIEKIFPKDLYDGEIARNDLFYALANILRQFKHKLELCMGTANSASAKEDAPKSLCGHCYGILTHHHLPTGAKTKSIMEGTNWIVQTKTCDSPAPYHKEVVSSVNTIATILMEATKTPTMPAKKDIGKSLAQIMEDKDNDFYQHVYALGENLCFQTVETRPGGPCVFVFGVPVEQIVNGSVYATRAIDYGLVAQHLKKESSLFHDLSPEHIKNTIRSIPHEEMVPPWSRNTWDTMKGPAGNQTKAKSLYSSDDNRNAYNPELHARFVFVHQACSGKNIEEFHNDISQNVQAVLINGKKPDITGQHIERLSAPPNYWNNANYPLNPKTKEMYNKEFPNLKNRVLLEEIYTCMQSVVCVCYVRRDLAVALKEKLTDWIKPLAELNNQKKELETKAYLAQLEKECGYTQNDLSGSKSILFFCGSKAKTRCSFIKYMK